MLFINQGAIRVHVKSPRVPKSYCNWNICNVERSQPRIFINQSAYTGTFLKQLQIYVTVACEPWTARVTHKSVPQFTGSNFLNDELDYVLPYIT